MGASGGNFWGELILDLRKSHNVSTRMLAEQTKICRTTLRRVEKGQAVCYVDMLEKVLGYFGYELEAIRTDNQAHRTARANEPAPLPEFMPVAKVEIITTQSKLDRLISLRL